MVVEALHNDAISGPVNAVMPEPVSNAEFTRALANALHRPALIPVPAFALRLLLGGLSHLLLDSQRILPGRFAQLGFRYRFPTVEAALAEYS